ncbi:hypothetical protein GCM10011386_07790 [Parapedobacter defluvii]|uniref:MarR family transcriptional regulator n=1 Tax=Parapedobacter defluvii TaxID=2045106 RepID=A0ABQ1L2E4_9SPHI|nr:hypothetical protein [Parapedobacter defluvii]GGC18330.1 hypothetical protein GCM10011386_07790 [Parapedobacter defluvii]
MKIDAHTLSDILVAHRRAIALYRIEYLPLGRNAIEVMLYAYGKSGITVTELSRNLLHTNINQTKNTIKTLILNGILWSFGNGVKGKPFRFYLTESGHALTDRYIKLFQN